MAVSGVRIVIFEDLAIAEAKATMGDALQVIGQAIADVARGSAPVDSGGFRDSIVCEGSGDKVTVEADDEGRAFFIEYGTSDTPAHATLTNAARQFGKYTGMQPGRR